MCEPVVTALFRAQKRRTVPGEREREREKK
jgi:hypothetical protein